jgi:hypothetical protein
MPTDVPGDEPHPGPLARAPQRMADLILGQHMAAGIPEDERATRIENARKDLVGKIRGFFGLERAS